MLWFVLNLDLIRRFMLLFITTSQKSTFFYFPWDSLVILMRYNILNNQCENSFLVILSSRKSLTVLNFEGLIYRSSKNIMQVIPTMKNIIDIYKQSKKQCLCFLNEKRMIWFMWNLCGARTCLIWWITIY